MAVYETFAKRKRAAENAGKPVIYIYDDLPRGLREQVVQILRDAIDEPEIPFPLPEGRARLGCWEGAYAQLAKEMGIPRLVSPDPYFQGYAPPCLEFIRRGDNVDEVLSLIELLFRSIEAQVEGTQNWFAAKQGPQDAIDELNHRFREHSVGYQYAGGQIVQVGNQYLHSEVVEPAIFLLRNAEFKGALDEFMDAHRHYRESRYKEAIAVAGSAFESTMKTICDRRSWGYERATSSALIEVLFNNGLVPSELQTHFTSLRGVVGSGLTNVRNQPGRGAHGQGSDPIEVPGYLAAYCLHLAAANIVFLIEAHNAKS